MKKAYLALALLGIVAIGCDTKTGVVVLVNGEGAMESGTTPQISGGVAGSTLDEEDQTSLKQNSSSTWRRIRRMEQLSIRDIIAMTDSDFSEDVIIAQIQNTGSVYNLRPDQFMRLREAGVSPKVIDYMVQTGNQ